MFKLKKYILPIFLVILGIVIFYFINKMVQPNTPPYKTCAPSEPYCPSDTNLDNAGNCCASGATTCIKANCPDNSTLTQNECLCNYY